MDKLRSLLPAILIVLMTGWAISGCAPVETGGEELDYDATKKMIVDILKTDEGKKAIQDLMKEDEIRNTLIMEQAVVSDTIEKTLVSNKGTEFWKKSFEDPKFAESFATSMRKEHEDLIKSLLKDPEYRKMMVELMKDPELEKELISTLKSNEYREHMQAVMIETFESPLYKAKLQDLIIKASEEITKQQDKQNSEGEETS
ncbi:spore germination lipoprotein GerD [Bacillus sp. B15-48]|uniref:spore germination lipoprotein GerD n=1 Tax=Bacillus sp. B15-48 TaxID=1548601 RepID=UPI00193F7721|nr:spore germination lipoprotein GerD [Bacillus sp. B15-48]MBM4764886.1 spore gernimation protein GerD [Bacillus sp. B15-48]